MQTKIIIGTIAFMLTMIILGFVALREPARMDTFTDAYAGRSIERGALVFANNCATCHGVNGRAEECYDPSSGEPTGCIGRRLNNPDMLCGTRPQRLVQTGWSGSKANFVRSAVAAGRPGTEMPAWLQDYGGPLQQNEVRNVTLFVLNWESEELCGDQEAVVGPEWPRQVSELPAGDAESGQELYAVTYGCQGCHGDPQGDAGTAAVGPWLGDIATVGAERIEDYTAADYLYESILKPNQLIAPECPTGDCLEPSAMPGDFGERMTLQDMADIMAYLLDTSEFESNVEVEYPAGAVPPETRDE
ncbi:MAG: c-type cytochrome [Candidatus Promineifilaceae bacterium]|nr:c-type cytochrome [Candidatus Promineifilaceae bacterium]